MVPPLPRFEKSPNDECGIAWLKRRIDAIEWDPNTGPLLNQIKILWIANSRLPLAVLALENLAKVLQRSLLVFIGAIAPLREYGGIHQIDHFSPPLCRYEIVSRSS
jgi:hypothetical protein